MYLTYDYELRRTRFVLRGGTRNTSGEGGKGVETKRGYEEGKRREAEGARFLSMARIERAVPLSGEFSLSHFRGVNGDLGEGTLIIFIYDYSLR